MGQVRLFNFWTARPSQNQHGVSITIESILGLDRLPIDGTQSIQPGEGRHQHEQGRAGKMEIGQQGIDDAEPVTREDEQVSFPSE